MTKPVVISKERPEKKDMDFILLREQGIDEVQKLAGKIWTDYNHHDPGVTILEQLCYAITDLGYRTSFDIEEILYARRLRISDSPNDTFFDASKIFPSNPVSLTDLRILLIDRVSQIKNAWVEPVRDNAQGIKGLYRVLLQVDDDLSRFEEEQTVQEVKGLMMRFRNLCEDVDSIEILQKEQISFSADIDIAPDAIGEELLAKILYELESYVNPTVRFYNLEELLDEGYDMEDAFNGPPPVHGFIKPNELHPLTTEIYISKLIEIISEIRGVTRIRNFVIYKNGIRVEGDVITIEKDHFPVLNTHLDFGTIGNQDFPIRFYRGQVLYNFDLNTANQILYSFSAKYKSGYQVKLIHDPKAVSTDLVQKELEAYYSIQHLFPGTYGVGPLGLPGTNNPERKAYAKQLKGYLMFFEQVLANYLAQLGNVANLFSLDENLDRTYFHQVPKDIPFFEDMVNGVENFEYHLENLVKESDPFFNRRNRFLDHILARFGETFSTDFLIKFNSYAEGLDPRQKEKFEGDLIKAKIKFLKKYVELSRDRGKGYDYSKPSFGNENVPALKKRVCLFLNIPDYSNKSLIGPFDPDSFETIELESEHLEKQEISPERPPEEDPLDYTSFKKKPPEEKPKRKGRRKKTKEEPNALDYKEGFVISSDSEAVFNELLRYGIHKHNFDIIPDPNDKNSWVVLFYSPETKDRTQVFQAASEEAASDAVDQLITYLRSINKDCEGFHLIENILLRRIAPEEYGFNLLDDNNDILLTSYRFADLSSLRIITDDLLIIGVIKGNYEVEVEGPSAFAILLKDSDGNRVGKVVEIFDTEKKAKEKINDIIDYLNSLKKGNTTIYSRVEFYSEHKRDLHILDDFYSLRISMILPSWPVRFQSVDFRDLLREFVVSNAPGHVVIDFIWLDPDEMGKFEQAYMPWLEEKEKEKPDPSNLDRLSFNLTDILQEFRKKKEK
ncbi:MAG: hypothetical protein AAF502_16080 [Bacteroidota bacterium]